MKDSFRFYTSYVDGLNGLPDKERLKMYDSLLNYAAFGKEPTFDDKERLLSALFELARPMLDPDGEYQEE